MMLHRGLGQHRRCERWNLAAKTATRTLTRSRKSPHTLPRPTSTQHFHGYSWT